VKDPIKSAIYNPKEFRRMRGHAMESAGGMNPRQGTQGRSWLAALVVALLIGGGFYAWDRSRVQKTLPLPVSGEFQRFYPPTLPALAPFKISAKDAHDNYFVKLEDWRTTAPVVSAFRAERRGNRHQRAPWRVSA